MLSWGAGTSSQGQRGITESLIGGKVTWLDFLVRMISLATEQRMIGCGLDWRQKQCRCGFWSLSGWRSPWLEQRRWLQGEVAPTTQAVRRQHLQVLLFVDCGKWSKGWGRGWGASGLGAQATESPLRGAMRWRSYWEQTGEFQFAHKKARMTCRASTDY